MTNDFKCPYCRKKVSKELAEFKKGYESLDKESQEIIRLVMRKLVK